MLSAALVVATLAGPIPPPAGPVHYQITLRSERRIEASASGEEARGGTYTVVAFVTAAVIQGPGGPRGEVVVDSVRCSGTGLMSMAFDTIVGMRSRGTKYDFPIGSRTAAIPTPSISNSLTNTLAQTALMIFPTMGPDQSVGATWSDSLDTSSMNNVSGQNRPVVTRWKVTGVGADSVAADGELRGSLTSDGRVMTAGLVTGIRHMTVAGGMLRSLVSTTHQNTVMASDAAGSMTVGTGTTSLQITAVR